MKRLVLKLLFKASLSLLLLVGTLSYGVHLRGGDPMGILRSVSSGIGDRIAGAVGNSAAEARRGVARLGGAFDPSGDEDRTTVFTWTDADGVTHFATSRPDDVTASTVRLDPNRNVLAPVVFSPPAAPSAPAAAQRSSVSGMIGQSLGVPVPSAPD